MTELEYWEQREFDDKLQRANKGKSLISPPRKSKEYFVRVLKSARQNLVERSSTIIVEHNLPLSRSWETQNPLKGFFEDLNRWVSIPRYEFFRIHNRKQENQPGYWRLTELPTQIIPFERIKITLGNEASLSMKFDFLDKLKELLSLQREATQEEARDFDRYFVLYNAIKDLKRFLGSSGYSYYGGYHRDTETMKISISKQEFNVKLKEIETELKQLCKKYKFLEMPRIEYQELRRKPTLKQFREEYLDELEEQWECLEDNEKAEFDGDFEEFVNQKYKEHLEIEEFDIG